MRSAYAALTSRGGLRGTSRVRSSQHVTCGNARTGHQARSQPQRGRVSSNDFNGSDGPARGRGADAGKYPEPEGWGQDGFWRDPSIDSDYETGTTGAIRPRRSGRSDSGTPGYSYWADGKGWENAPGLPPPAAAGAGRTASGAPRGTSGRATGNGSAGGRSRNGNGYGPGGDPTAYYGAAAGGYGAGGPAGPGGPGGPGGPRRGGPGGPGGPRGHRGGKVKGSWWRRWTWKKVVGLVGAMAGLVILLGVGAYFYTYNSASIPTQLAANVLDQNSTVYYSDGKTPIGPIGPIDRQLLTYSQIPMRVQDAVLAAEDRSFWTE